MRLTRHGFVDYGIKGACRYLQTYTPSFGLRDEDGTPAKPLRIVQAAASASRGLLSPPSSLTG
jgi:hypothetical protein